MISLASHRSKRWWTVVGISGVAILCVTIYILYSILSWQGYQQRVSSWQQSTKQALTTVFSLQSTSEKERNDKIAAFKAVARDIHQAETSICNPARLTGWQLVIGGIRETREECGSYLQKAGRIAEQLDTVTAYLNDEAAITKVLQPTLALPDAIDETDWDQTVAAWKKVSTDVNTLSTSQPFTVTRRQVTTVLTDIDTSWSELIAAHAKKDKGSFVAAVTKLQVSYAALTSINTVNDSQLSSLSTELQQRYSQL